MEHQYWYTAPTIGPGNVFTGNRILAPDTRGGFSIDADYFDIELQSDIKWLVATSSISGPPQFVATTEDGLAYAVTNASAIEQLNYPTISEGFDPERPPLVVTANNGTTPIIKILELPSSAKLSTLSHPVSVFPCTGNDVQCGILVYIDASSNIILYDLAKDQKLGEIANINALPDARIVMAPTNKLDLTNNENSKLLAVYGGAKSYPHCVLGDCIEGSSLLLIEVSKNNDDSYSMTLERQITLPSGTIFEGLSPMFIKDGEMIVTTVANSANGAWLRTYDVFCGDTISESAYIGWGWRHMLFYNNFAPIENDNDPLYSMVDVLTPHVRKQLEFFDIAAGGTMEMRSSKSKYTTHDIGWRYLDTAISGDLNGDGINEAILLDENLERLVSLQLVNDSSGVSVQEVWSLPLVGKLSSNIAAVSYSGEIESGVALAAASGKKMRVWISPSRDDNKMDEDVLPSSTSTTSYTSTTSTLPAGTEENYASNDEFGINLSNAEPKNCGAQTTNAVATKSGISLAAMVLVLFFARH